MSRECFACGPSSLLRGGEPRPSTSANPIYTLACCGQRFICTTCLSAFGKRMQKRPRARAPLNAKKQLFLDFCRSGDYKLKRRSHNRTTGQKHCRVAQRLSEKWKDLCCPWCCDKDVHAKKKRKRRRRRHRRQSPGRKTSQELGRPRGNATEDSRKKKPKRKRVRTRTRTRTRTRKRKRQQNLTADVTAGAPRPSFQPQIIDVSFQCLGLDGASRRSKTSLRIIELEPNSNFSNIKGKHPPHAFVSDERRYTPPPPEGCMDARLDATLPRARSFSTK